MNNPAASSGVSTKDTINFSVASDGVLDPWLRNKIEKATGLKLGRADGTYVKENVGYAIGGVPPVGHNESLNTILDPDLKKYEEIWAAAGTPFAVFQLKPTDLESLTKGRWVDLSEEI
jgi:prolyl-tRNA editing enzyme YbaK/EbsC (Cys-tRNA(Pro) deacylase)